MSERVSSDETVCRGLERGRHVALTRDYLAHFGKPDLVGPLPVARPLVPVEVAEDSTKMRKCPFPQVAENMDGTAT